MMRYYILGLLIENLKKIKKRKELTFKYFCSFLYDFIINVNFGSYLVLFRFYENMQTCLFLFRKFLNFIIQYTKAKFDRNNGYFLYFNNISTNAHSQHLHFWRVPFETCLYYKINKNLLHRFVIERNFYNEKLLSQNLNFENSLQQN